MQRDTVHGGRRSPTDLGAYGSENGRDGITMFVRDLPTADQRQIGPAEIHNGRDFRTIAVGHAPPTAMPPHSR